MSDDDTYTETELELRVRTYNARMLLKKHGYAVFTKDEWVKRNSTIILFVFVAVMMMLGVGVLLGRTL